MLQRIEGGADLMRPVMTVFIDGEAGTTGLGIRERLRATARHRAAQHRARAAQGSGAPSASSCADVDLVVLCLPDDAARETVPWSTAWAAAVRASSTPARRIGSRPAGSTALPNSHAGQARGHRGRERVANPGCYPTGAIALLRPLVEAGLIPADHPISVNAVSGYSGGGRTHDRGLRSRRRAGLRALRARLRAQARARDCRPMRA